MNHSIKRFYAKCFTAFYMCLSAHALSQWQPFPEIHCKHFLYGCPYPTKQIDMRKNNDLIIREIYALSSNDSTKFADWVAYRLTPDMIDGPDRSRHFRKEPWLTHKETLDTTAYDSAYKAHHYHRGHLAPLQSFSDSPYWNDTNYLSNIIPQVDSVNSGTWMKLENRVRKVVSKYSSAYVITGTLCQSEEAGLPKEPKQHTVPSGFYKIVMVDPVPEKPDSIRGAAFILNQETPPGTDLMTCLFPIDTVESRAGFDFFWGLPDSVEAVIEDSVFADWAKGFFRN